MRKPSMSDGANIWTIFRDSHGLDLNSSYCYLLLADQFADTCLVAEANGELAGAVIAYRKPQDPTTLFVWQVGVATRFQGHGVARAMLDRLVDQLAPTWVEATIGPSNRASHALFGSVAACWSAELRTSAWLTPDDFPDSGHEAEELIRIGPIPTSRFDDATPTGRVDHDTRMATP